MAKNTPPKAPKKPPQQRRYKIKKTFDTNGKPPRQRGYKIKKTFDIKGNPSYEKVPRSGYASAFLRLFTLFLAILVLGNVVMGWGYDGYRVAVRTLYGFTEVVGGTVIRISEGLVGAVKDFNTDFDSIVGDPNNPDHDTILYSYCTVRYWFDTHYYKLTYLKEDGMFLYYTVIESSYDKVNVGDVLQMTLGRESGDDATIVCTAYNSSLTEKVAYKLQRKVTWIKQEEYNAK